VVFAVFLIGLWFYYYMAVCAYLCDTREYAVYRNTNKFPQNFATWICDKNCICVLLFVRCLKVLMLYNLSDIDCFCNTVKPVYNDHLGTLKLWPLLTGDHCSYIIKIEIGPFKWWPF
jgi:hypothetical protein